MKRSIELLNSFENYKFDPAYLHSENKDTILYTDWMLCFHVDTELNFGRNWVEIEIFVNNVKLIWYYNIGIERMVSFLIFRTSTFPN